MGFDAKTKERHRIYWLEKRTVTVKQNIKFNFEPDEIVVEMLPLKGERRDGEHLTAIESKKQELDNETTAPVLESNTGRGQQIRKETEYVRMLKDGSVVTGIRRGGVLPKGMRPGTTITQAVDNKERVKHAMTVNLEPEFDYAMASIIKGLEPMYEEAQRCPDWPKWEESIKELDGLERMPVGTWRLVKRPPDANVVDTKWILKINKNSAGEVKKYKARLVARGFTQIYGVNYYETYVTHASFGCSKRMGCG